MASLTTDREDTLLLSHNSSLIEFPSEGLTFERTTPLTDLRKDHDESRILFLCRLRKDTLGEDTTQTKTIGGEYVMKVKIQAPMGKTSQPLRGPSAATALELQALEDFRKSQASCVPHLVAVKLFQQGPKSDVPGGYICATVMTKMPGKTLWDLKFWSLDTAERDIIREKFWSQIQQIWKLGIVPYDCALRNIMWDGESQTCSIIDFEYWRPCFPADLPSRTAQKQQELQKWGLVQRPPPATWAQEWGIIS